MPPLLSIIIVTFDSERWIKKCITSLEQQDYHTFEVIMVDNDSHDNILEAIKGYRSIKLIKNNKNIGFSAACNMGILQASGEYLLFLNPDVVVKKDTIKVVLSYLGRNKDVGIVSCRLCNEEGTLQYSCRRFPGLMTQLVKRFFPNSKIVIDYLMVNSDHFKIMDVDWLLGAFLFVRRKVFDDVGLFDENFFLYFEDVDFCYRAKKNGWRVVYYPLSVATHMHVRASRRFLSKEAFHHLRSMFHYYNKHGWRLF